MEPRIQYATTKDGVSIAYWTMGDGPALVCTPPLAWSHIQLERGMPELARWYGRMAAERMLVRYDFRGAGLSQRDVADLSLDAQVEDIRAVADGLGIKQLALLGVRPGGIVAISYAARYPERVSHLILWSCYARYAEAFLMQQEELLASLSERDWVAYTETYAHLSLGWSQGEQAHQFARFVRESITQETFRAALSEMRDANVTDLLPKITCPTLVLSDGEYPNAATELASKISNASLVLVQARKHSFAGLDSVAVAIEEFLGDGPAAKQPATLTPSGTAVILFLDIANSTALTTQLGDAAYRDKERALDAALRAAITDAGGTPVEGKVLGDGVMAVFTSARQAINAAQRCRDLGNQAGLPLHLGIHAGDVVREGNNVHGGAVQLASRVQAAAAPGEILVSQTVRDLARTSAGVAFEDRGEHDLRGITEPQRLFAIQEPS